ncbi:hypothetical protein COO60DRAFT_517416 [Scenedesmus sp. NREL 46B-D3]|nr:hypothetical protein COO60DRAFT_517416 [Scenedesmus sp. NREL 46B-D3]
MSLLKSYKGFVRAHPGLVLNAERLLHWVAWNPERFSGSEYAYEGFNAAVGLLGIYNESILTEHPDYNVTVAKYALWLAAVEQVQTLVELRAIQLEQRGKMSRYGPLMALELIKVLLRLQLWRSSKCTLALEAVSQEDQQQHECEQQLQELLQALTRLRQRYSCDEMAAPTPSQLAWQQQLLQEQRVRSAAIAPHRPPAACAAGELAHAHGPTGTSSNGCSGSSSNVCLSCGDVGGRVVGQQHGSSDSSSNSRLQQHSSGGGGGASLLPRVPEITPAGMPGTSSSKLTAAATMSLLGSAGHCSRCTARKLGSTSEGALR